ncbi:MAG: hypothetical protein ACPGKS_07150 [Coraliomargarita sp.]
MKRFRPVRLHPSLISLGLIAGSALWSNQSLKENSPFLPPGYGVEAPKPPPPPPQVNGPVAQQLEFRGLMKMGGQYSFSLFDKRNQKGYWLTENQAQDGIRVGNYDANALTVVVTMNGRTERLTLMSASDAPLPVTASISKPASNKTKTATLPPGIPGNTNKDANKRTIPRRRVILPKK